MMGWRENMGVKNLKSQEQKPQKEQKPPEQTPFATIAPFALEDQKIKKTSTPPPDLSKINPDDRAEYTTLWNQAHKLADFIDGGEAMAPYETRIKRMPELNGLVERMREIETRPNAVSTHRSVKKIPGLQDDLIQAPAVWAPSAPEQTDRDACPACGQSNWWRADEPKSKWICGRCHPPAKGLDVIFSE